MIKFILMIIAAYLALLLFLYIVQRHLIYFPSKQAITPEEAGVPEMHEVELKTEDGLAIKAWYKEPVNPEYPTIVYFHGNAGNIGNRAFIVKPFLDEGFGVLLLTYRGYSGNPGSPSEKGLYMDARAAMEFVQGQNLVLHGTSIGAAVAIQMATEYPIKALVLQSPFSSLSDVGQYHYPFLPIRWLAKDRYDSINKVNEIRAPVFILYGLEDQIIPPHLTEKLYEALPEPKEIHPVPKRGHNDLFKPDLVIHFIQQLPN